MTGRTVGVLVSHGQRWLGALEPFPVESPWWPDVEPVNSHLTTRLGVETSVLRLIDASGTAPRDGTVTYHVEVADDVTAAVPWRPIPPATAAQVMAVQPRRRPWAKPGGPALDVRWADAALAAAGRRRVGPATQVKTWNLSCVHKLPTDEGNVWLKVTGPEQTREEIPIAEVAAVDRDLVAQVVAADPERGRIVCAELPGRDLPDQHLDVVVAAVERWVHVQAELATTGTEALVRSGVRAWPMADLADPVERLLREEKTSALSATERAQLGALLRELSGRTTAIRAAGVPDTLVHGDFTPINWRGDQSRVAIMDWSDAYVGHPAADLVALLSRMPAEWHPAVIEAWCRTWGEAVPGSDPSVTVDLVRPLVHMRMALVYAAFLDAIEESEWCYHEDDPVAQLRLALETWHE